VAKEPTCMNICVFLFFYLYIRENLKSSINNKNTLDFINMHIV